VIDPNGFDLAERQKIAAGLLNAVSLVGENLAVRYERILISVQARTVPVGSLGCVLTAAPYLKLAKGSVPAQGVAALEHMTVREWESEVSDRFLGKRPRTSPDYLREHAVRDGV